MGAFPFKLEDLESWTVRRTDGTVTKFMLTTVQITGDKQQARTDVYNQSTTSQYPKHDHLSKFCHHVPQTAVFEISAEDRPGVKAPLGLYVGSISSKSVKDQFDFVLDCGNVISSWEMQDKILEGDKELQASLEQHVSTVPGTRVLKVDWFDRRAPNLAPSFWPAFNALVHGDVLTCCQGGHGRSGTSFVCLLMCNAPDYDALDAIVHLRAVHCPRAIESAEQHQYIDEVATFLGRKANAAEVSKIHDYKAAFTAIMKPTAVMTRKALGW